LLTKLFPIFPAFKGMIFLCVDPQAKSKIAAIQRIKTDNSVVCTKIIFVIIFRYFKNYLEK